jgi:hypothetical protein
MEPLPYNITLSSQTASIQYFPSRDGSTSATGWNVSYTNGLKDTGHSTFQGVGVDYHQTTLPGAYMELSWVGTAVYLYGNASAGSYIVLVDGEDIGSNSNKGVLASKSGLDYGNHNVRLTARGGSQVVFQYAQVTIGMGYPGYVCW